MARAVNVLLLVGLGLLFVLVATVVIARANRIYTRVCLELFRDSVEQSGRKREERKRLLQSIHATSTYPVYASKTIAYAGIVAIAGSLFGAAAVYYAFTALTTTRAAILAAIPPELHFVVPSGLETLGTGELFVGFVVITSAVGAGAGAALRLAGAAAVAGDDLGRAGG